jgi:Group II intron, maturase-specific domain
MQHARDRIRDLTARSRLRLWPELIAEDLNRFLRGWAAYFRFGNSADRFGKISEYARLRMALFVAKRTRRSRKFGWAVLACRSPDQLGLITLSGIVVAPYPFKDWRVKPNAAVNGVGEPCAGEPHARFDAAGAGNGAPGHGHAVKRPAGETRGKVAAGPHAGQRHRASPRPYPVHRRADASTAMLMACDGHTSTRSPARPVRQRWLCRPSVRAADNSRHGHWPLQRANIRRARQPDIRCITPTRYSRPARYNYPAQRSYQPFGRETHPARLGWPADQRCARIADGFTDRRHRGCDLRISLWA